VAKLAFGHLKALERLSAPQCFAINLGTGCAYSVLDLVKACGRTSGRRIPYELDARHSGDVASCYCNPKLAAEFLSCCAESGIDPIHKDAWRLQQNNPIDLHDSVIGEAIS
jgi:UDP-glucose 4-epimerase